MARVYAYQTNPECKYQSGVPLTEREQDMLRFERRIHAARAVVLAAALIFVLAVMWEAQELVPFLAFLLAPCLALMAFGFARLARRTAETKEIFESVLVKCSHEYRRRFSITIRRYLRFQDMYDGCILLDGSVKLKNLKIGSRYRVHKVAGRTAIVGLEEVSGGV